jgi:general secretion pathway protein A
MEHYQYYGMQLDPFSNTPDNRFYFNSDQHSLVLTKLLYIAKSMKGLAILIGEVGTGKTTLARKLLMSLPDEEYDASMLVIIHSGISADWLLTRIAAQLGVENPADDKIKLLGQLFARLTEIQASGKSAIILVDEAQMLKSREVMEEFRGLLNIETPGKKFISFIFFGLPELEESLKQDEPLNQRVALRLRLQYMNIDSTEKYIKHRLKVAGATKMLFTREALEEIQRYSRGIPRVINNICDNALLEGMFAKADVIDRTIVEKVALELSLKPATRDELEQIESHRVVVPQNDRGTVEGRPRKAAETAAPVRAAEAPPAPPARPEEPHAAGQDAPEDIDIDKILDSLDID